MRYAACSRHTVPRTDHLDPPLSGQGAHQAKELGLYLKGSFRRGFPPLVFHGPARRKVQTAMIVASMLNGRSVLDQRLADADNLVIPGRAEDLLRYVHLLDLAQPDQRFVFILHLSWLKLFPALLLADFAPGETLCSYKKGPGCGMVMNLAQKTSTPFGPF